MWRRYSVWRTNPEVKVRGFKNERFNEHWATARMMPGNIVHSIIQHSALTTIQRKYTNLSDVNAHMSKLRLCFIILTSPSFSTNQVFVRLGLYSVLEILSMPFHTFHNVQYDILPRTLQVSCSQCSRCNFFSTHVRLHCTNKSNRMFAQKFYIGLVVMTAEISSGYQTEIGLGF